HGFGVAPVKGETGRNGRPRKCSTVVLLACDDPGPLICLACKGDSFFGFPCKVVRENSSPVCSRPNTAVWTPACCCRIYRIVTFFCFVVTLLHEHCRCKSSKGSNVSDSIVAIADGIQDLH